MKTRRRQVYERKLCNRARRKFFRDTRGMVPAYNRGIGKRGRSVICWVGKTALAA